LITHDADVAKKAPRILEIVDGHVTDRKSAWNLPISYR
jgi:ABC-type lipoprotein export system ATPase subunit